MTSIYTMVWSQASSLLISVLYKTAGTWTLLWANYLVTKPRAGLGARPAFLNNGTTGSNPVTCSRYSYCPTIAEVSSGHLLELFLWISKDTELNRSAQVSNWTVALRRRRRRRNQTGQVRSMVLLWKCTLTRMGHRLSWIVYFLLYWCQFHLHIYLFKHLKHEVHINKQ